MNRKEIIKKALIAGLFSIAMGGWLLHIRIHPPLKNPDSLIPFICGMVSVFCLPFLFWFRQTIVLAYVINGFFVIIGTITMAHFSIARFEGPISAANIILNTTLADIAILWGRFTVGKAIFDLEFLNSGTDEAQKGCFFRYPHMGWWWVHLFALAVVYGLGNVIWK